MLVKMNEDKGKTNWPLIIVIVVNWNGVEITYEDKSILDTTLETLKKADYKTFKVVVADAESEDKSTMLIQKKFKYADIIKIPNKGWGYIANRAIKYAFKKYPNLEYILLLNNDLKFNDPGWLKKFIKISNDDVDIGIMGCKLYAPDGTPQGSGSYSEKFYSLSSNKKSGYTDTVNGAVLLIKKNVMKEIGLFDEIYLPFFGEESDLCMRSNLAGYKSYFLSDTDITHLGGYTIMKSKLKRTWTKRQLEYIAIRNDWIFLLRWYPYLLPINLAYNIVQSFIKNDNGLHLRNKDDIIFRLSSISKGLSNAFKLYKKKKIPMLK